MVQDDERRKRFAKVENEGRIIRSLHTLLEVEIAIFITDEVLNILLAGAGDGRICIELLGKFQVSSRDGVTVVPLCIGAQVKYGAPPVR